MNWYARLDTLSTLTSDQRVCKLPSFYTPGCCRSEDAYRLFNQQNDACTLLLLETFRDAFSDTWGIHVEKQFAECIFLHHILIMRAINSFEFRPTAVSCSNRSACLIMEFLVSNWNHVGKVTIIYLVCCLMFKNLS